MVIEGSLFHYLKTLVINYDVECNVAQRPVNWKKMWRNFSTSSRSFSDKIADKHVPYTQKIFISINFRHFRLLKELILKLISFTLFLCTCML